MRTLSPSVQDGSAQSPNFHQELLASADPMAMLTGSSKGRGGLGEDARRGHRVEVARSWGPTLLEMRHLELDGASLSVGGTKEPLPGLEEEHELLSVDQGEVLVSVLPEWEVQLLHAPNALPLAERSLDLGVSRQVPLNEGEQLVLIIGEFCYVIRLVTAARKVLGRRETDLPFFGVTAMSAFLAAMLGVVAWTAPPRMDTKEVVISDAMAEIFIQDIPELVPKKVKPPSEVEGAKHEREAGKIGERDALLKAATGEPLRGRELDQAIAGGVFGHLADSGLSSVFGGNAIPSGLGDFIGQSAGPKGIQLGVGGYSYHDGGPGGGGVVGSLDMGQGLRGPGTGMRDYEGGSDLGPRGTMKLPSSRETMIMGSMDRSQIDSVIKKHLSQFRYCYQRELTKNPDLGGKVVLKFTIAKDGHVSTSKTKASSLGNKAAEGCMNKTMYKMVFPQPKGGGIVIVSYPFLFSAS